MSVCMYVGAYCMLHYVESYYILHTTYLNVIFKNKMFIDINSDFFIL